MNNWQPDGERTRLESARWGERMLRPGDRVRLRPRGKLYYRLQLGTPSKKHAKQLCGNLKSTGRACTVA